MATKAIKRVLVLHGCALCTPQLRVLRRVRTPQLLTECRRAEQAGEPRRTAFSSGRLSAHLNPVRLASSAHCVRKARRSSLVRS